MIMQATACCSQRLGVGPVECLLEHAAAQEVVISWVPRDMVGGVAGDDQVGVERVPGKLARVCAYA